MLRPTAAGQPNALAGIFNSIPELRSQPVTLKSRVNSLLVRKIEKLSRKLAMSPYQPCEQHDPLRLNSDFPTALYKWLLQFPENHRLGFLLIALSTNYLTEAECDLFLEISIQRLSESILEQEHRVTTHYDFLDPDIRSRLRPYPISAFSAWDAFIHRLHVSGSRDHDRQMTRGILDDFLADAFNYLRRIAEEGKIAPYLDQINDYIQRLIASLDGAYIILVEDCSFSGTRISQKVEQLLRLLAKLFVNHESALREAGYQLPHAYLLVTFGTPNALELVEPSALQADGRLWYPNYKTIFGFTFDSTSFASAILPENLNELQDALHKINLHKKAQQSLSYFFETYGHHYPSVDKHTPMGFKNGGWTIVTHRNSPNNSLPPLWFPSSESREVKIDPLFRRIESRVTHAHQSDRLEEDLDIVWKDKQGHIKSYLTDIYAKMK